MAQAVENFSPQVIVCRSREEFHQKAAERFVGLYEEAVSTAGLFTVVLAGGTTPGGVYRHLAGQEVRTKVDWNKVHFFFGDERYVPGNHPGSNYGMAEKIFFSKIPVPRANLHPMETRLPDPRGAAEEYEKRLRTFFNLREEAFPRFDLIFLGVGEDGHTASLFPGLPELKEKKRWVVAPFVASLKAYRLTLTLPVLNQAKHIVFLVSGARKAEIIKTLFQHAAERLLPVQKVRPVQGDLVFLVDPEAASKLDRSFYVC